MKTIVYLEGQPVLDHSSYVENLVNPKNYNHIVLDNLYENYHKLLSLKYLEPDFVYISTTGVYKDKIDTLIEVFEITEYIPKSVIFNSERSVMVLLGLARELKEKGTKFYYLYEDDLEEINWI